MLSPTLAAAETARVAVAANFRDAADLIARHVEAQTEHEIVLIAGSTGKLYAQVRNGAPFDVFLSADAERPAILLAEGLGVPGTLRTYAVGRLAFYAPTRIDDPVALLKSGRITTLAIANPALAPYGNAAQEVLTHLVPENGGALRIVMGENVGQAYALIVQGGAEAGLIAFSSIRSPSRDALDNETVFPIPPALHRPILQDAVLLKRAADNPAALAFLDALFSPFAQTVRTQLGYGAD